MNTLFSGLSVLQAQGDATGQFTSLLITFVPIILIMYLLVIRPQNKKQKQLEKMISSLQKGDKVITIGGVHGTVVSAKDHTVVLKVDDSCKIEFSRNAISTILTDPADKSDDKKAEKIEDKKADDKKAE